MNTKPKLLIFDVNETLLDMSPLKQSINQALNNDWAFDIWFPSLLQYSLVETCIGTYHDFSKIAAATFRMTASKFELNFTEEEIKEILSPISTLKPHTDVVKALSLLKENKMKMIALTNGKPKVAQRQLKYAGIDHFFDEVISVEVVKKYKPHPDTYQYVLNKYSVNADRAMMIAAHGWDIAGAQQSGLQTAFIGRAGKFKYPLAEKPTLDGPDCLTIAKSLLSS
jgi:2-haloacid dehalogenase